MIHFERTRDFDQVRSILTHPAVWPHIGEDASPAADDWSPSEHPGIWYVLTRQDERIMGLFIFLPQNSICYELHLAMLPHAWGPSAAEAGREIFGWMFTHSPARRIVASAPANNRLVVRYCERIGLKYIGVNARSFPKNGKLHDQILFGISPI